jgi:hypothetical protein
MGFVRDGERLFRTLLDAVAAAPPDSRERSAANGYPEMLSRAVALALSRLPAAAAIAATAGRTASRGAGKPEVASMLPHTAHP